MSGAVAGGLILAAVCALGTNVGWLIKHRGVQHSPRMSHRRPWQSVRALFNSRAFVIGLAIATGAGAGLLHIVALAFAPISIVQAVMAGGVVILAVLAEPISGWRVTPRQWTGVMFSAGGLIILALALPTIHGAHNAYSTPTMVVFELVAGMLGGLLLLSPRISRLTAHDGALIGAASGVFFGVADLAVKALLGASGHGPLEVLLSPWLPLALTAGLAAQHVSARSLQTGDAVAVTAMTGLTVNVLNIVGGILIFGDPFANSLAGVLAEATAFSLICAATFPTPVPELETSHARAPLTA